MALLPYDDRDGVIWFDGQFVPWREARVHVLSHSLHYGSAAFEGERVYDGRVFKLSQHDQRLLRSCELLGYSLPYSAEELDLATQEVVARNKIGDGYVRPIAWRGAETIGVSARDAKPHVAIAAFPWPAYYSEEARTKGIALMTSSWQRPSPKSAPTASKAAGLYMICTMSRDTAAAAGFDDALMHDYRGQVAEATGANLFMAIGGALHTPTPDCFLDGITRRTVIDLARQRDIRIIERAIFPEELANAEEIFLTGTAVEVIPVRQIDKLQIPVGPIARQLSKDYQRLVRAG